VSASAAQCFDVATPIGFDPPAMWDGTCTAPPPVMDATSVTVFPPVVLSNKGCVAAGSFATKVEGGSTSARICEGLDRLASGLCGTDGEVCAFPPAPGFSMCLLGDAGSDLTCPLSWPNKHIFFDNALECSCSCGSPMGESCSSTVTFYTDTACTAPLGTLSTESSPCAMLAPGTTLKGESATPSVYAAGTCPPILVNSVPTTVCCQP
jgi:hypothetical protein